VGVPTFTLAYWVRHRHALALEDAVRRLTLTPASLWGLTGRGCVRPGWYADLNVIDLDTLDLGPVEIRHDLPGGAVNLSQQARGYEATVVNGQVLMRAGVHTGALPGRVLRGAPGPG
jgi:N-acyl-D-aspartate/D-glutamate deacylase